MKLIVFVEEESAQAALDVLLPRMIPAGCGKQVINLQSKSQLLRKIEKRLQGYYPQCAGNDIRIAVLVDRDNDNCTDLKQQLEEAARRAGFSTRTNPQVGQGPSFRVLNRVVIEELESWFLGDAAALRAAFANVGNLNVHKAPLNNPDNGGTWEVLERFLRKHGYRSSYKKIDGARKIAARMDPASNRSASFRAFRDGLADLLNQPAGQA